MRHDHPKTSARRSFRVSGHRCSPLRTPFSDLAFFSPSNSLKISSSRSSASRCARFIFRSRRSCSFLSMVRSPSVALPVSVRGHHFFAFATWRIILRQSAVFPEKGSPPRDASLNITARVTFSSSPPSVRPIASQGPRCYGRGIARCGLPRSSGPT